MGAGTRRPLLAQATMFVFFSTTAWTGIISSDFYASDRLVYPHVSPIVVYLTFRELSQSLNQLIPIPPWCQCAGERTSTPRSTNNSNWIFSLWRACFIKGDGAVINGLPRFAAKHIIPGKGSQAWRFLRRCWIKKFAL